jgi:PAS domain S-box-containing protein
MVDTQHDSHGPASFFRHAVPELRTFLALAATGVAAELLKVQIPHTEVYIEGRWAAGFLGFAILPRLRLAVLLALVLSLPFFSDVAFPIGMAGNLLYALPSLALIRLVHGRLLCRLRLWPYALGWLALTLLCYQAFTTPAIWATIAVLRDDAIWPAVVRAWRQQPFFVESMLVAIVSGSALFAIRGREELLRSEYTFRTLVECANDIIVAISPAGVFQYVSPNWRAILGHRPSRVLGDSYERYIHPDDIGACRDFLNRIVSTRTRRGGVEYRVRHADGSWRWHAASGSPRLDARGAVSALIVISRDITERKRSEQRLRENVKLMRYIIRYDPNAIAVYDRDLHYIAVSDRYLHDYNVTDPDIIGKHHYEVFPEMPQKWKDVHARVLAGATERNDDDQFVRPDGSVTYNRWECRPWRRENGDIGGMITYTEVTTERKLAEKALRESEERLRLATETIDSVFWINSRDFSRILYISKGYERIWRRPVAKLLAAPETLLEAVHPDDRRDYRRVFESSHIAGEPYACEYRIIDGEGQCRWIAEKGFPVEANGRDDLMTGICTDITEQKQASEALAAERERLAVTLESIADGVITTGADGRIMLLNRVAEKLTGWTAREARGRRIDEVFRIVDARDGQTIENPVHTALSAGRTPERADHAALTARDGTRRLIADSGAPITSAAGEILGAVMVFRDVTDELRIQEAMQRTARLESLGVLAGGIAHDFNNLLGGIYGYIDMARECAAQPEIAAYCAKSLMTIDRARGLTGQLLTFSRGGAPAKKTGPLFPLVAETARFALSGSNCECVVAVEPGLWECDFDRGQISQVIDNIVLNAKQAMPGGGTVTVRARNVVIDDQEHAPLPAGAYVRISIEDQGVGIDPSVREKIFDPFFSTKQEGHGLGLATSFSIVERHAGTIEVDSSPGAGSVFHVFLPASSKSAPARQSAHAASHAGSGVVLVMDDEEVMRDITGEMLRSLGYEAVCVDAGAAAVEYVRANRRTDAAPCAIILDLTIPGGMGGAETLAAVRALEPDTPAFVASGYSEDPVMAHPATYGFAASIRKPFRKAELAALLERFLDNGRTE